MKKIFLIALLACSTLFAHAQFGNLFKKKKDTTAKTQKIIKKKEPALPKEKKDWSKIDLSKRTADHLMFQFGSDSWTGRPDSINTKGFGRHFNFYFLLDKPFKKNPYFSLAYGLGFGTSNIYFNKRFPDLSTTSNSLPFTNQESGNHYKKTKVTTVYAEIPVELRYYSNPEDPSKSWKLALGAKLGTLIKSYSKAKDLQTQDGASIYGSSYIVKESNKRFFNGTRIAATARVGYGNLSLNVEYQISSVLRDGAGPDMHTLSIGLVLSGL